MRATCVFCGAVSTDPGPCQTCAAVLNAAKLKAVQPKSLSERERVLLDGVELTGGDRNRTYGAPAPNLALQLALWTLYKDLAGDKHSPAHDAAMQHVFAKIARIASGKRGHRDNYVDAATYIAIAYECDTEEQDGAQP